MFDIAKYLEKFKVMGNSRIGLRDSVAEGIQVVCGIQIEPKNIDIKDGIARVSAKPIIKNELFLKKAKIIDFIYKKTSKNITDII
jgi:hypothetical protein